jgi:hypothetical protein
VGRADSRRGRNRARLPIVWARPGQVFVWPVADGKVEAGVPFRSEGRFFGAEPFPLTALRDEIARQTPETVNLHDDLLAVLLFAARGAALARRESRRAAYVRFVAAVLDLERDVAALAGLLESSDGAVRTELLTALAQTGDARGLDVLMAAAKDATEKQNVIELARGLARIKDNKALPVLAALAEKATDPQQQWEVVNAFGHVSGLFPASPPHRFWSSGAIYPDKLKAGQEAIARWRREQPR